MVGGWWSNCIHDVDYYHPLTGELKVREIDGNDNFAEQGQE